MKNFARIVAVATFSFLTFALQSFTTQPVVSATPPDFIIIPASTAVSLAAHQTYTSEDVEVGAQVDFTVRADVMVNRTVVIKAGAIASGEVTRVIKADKTCTTCVKGCPMMQIELKNVQSVGGIDVNLRSTPMIIKAPCETCPAVLDISKTVSARVLNNTRIEL
jgi:hypothetical protein